ncbi:hypothetical protein BUALT_Bualt14G0092100 [Buddleja alternifolia]|uniref:Amine oxidase n=1 Tax=Buddleja alternifolia TaxID=168488 RepID=A0AAV6WP64_9LAMI|nr:hypothetical protein BUALT_Bualt14G0092100 [Buddleja alternifolia]
MEEADNDRPPPITVTPNQKKKKLKRQLVGASSPIKTTAQNTAAYSLHEQHMDGQVQSEGTTQPAIPTGTPHHDTIPEKVWSAQHLKDTWSRKVNTANKGDTKGANLAEAQNTPVPTTHGPWNIVQQRIRRGPPRRENIKKRDTTQDSPIFFFGQGTSQANKGNKEMASGTRAPKSTSRGPTERKNTEKGKHKMPGTELNASGSRFNVLNEVGEEELSEEPQRVSERMNPNAYEPLDDNILTSDDESDGDQDDIISTVLSMERDTWDVGRVTAHENMDTEEVRREPCCEDDIDGDANFLIKNQLRTVRVIDGSSLRKSYWKVVNEVAKIESDAKIRLGSGTTEIIVVNPSKKTKMGNIIGYHLIPGSLWGLYYAKMIMR